MNESELQRRLEFEGWTHLFNITRDRLNPDIFWEDEFPYRDIMVKPIIINPSENEKYNLKCILDKLKDNPKKIKVTDAYNMFGKLLHDRRAIYII